MKKILLSSALFFLLHGEYKSVNNFSVSKDTSKTKSFHRKGIFLGGGTSISSISFYRNVMQNPYRFCYHARAYAEVNDFYRFCIQYTYMPKFDFKPTWLNVTNMVFDVDFHIMAKISDEKAIFYTVTGICVQRWKGQYTGIKDFNNLRDLHNYTPGNYYVNNYPGFSLGVGIERSLNEMQFFSEFRYRFTATESGFGITDAAFNVGLKFFIPAPEKRYRGPGKKYNWF